MMKYLNMPMFQSTLLRKERPSLSIFPLLPYMFQSTLLRKERPFLNSQEGHSIGVSIHAPTKGATCSMCGFGIHMEVSIHAPTKGATRTWFWRPGRRRPFQSTLLRKERQATNTIAAPNAMFQSTLLRKERQKAH